MASIGVARNSFAFGQKHMVMGCASGLDRQLGYQVLGSWVTRCWDHGLPGAGIMGYH